MMHIDWFYLVITKHWKDKFLMLLKVLRFLCHFQMCIEFHHQRNLQSLSNLLQKISLKISFWATNFIRNNITRSLIIFGINNNKHLFCLFQK